MKSAIISTGGKQYSVKEGADLRIEKIDKKEGASVNFDKVLYYTDGKQTEIGQPLVKNIVVSGKVLKQAKAKKVMVVKFKSKVHYRRKRGHRQLYTLVKIEKIGPGK